MSKRKINDAKQLIAESTATNAPAKKKEGALGIMSRVAKYLTAAIVLLVLFWFGFTYEVREGSCAVVLRFGAVRAETEEAPAAL